MTCRVLATLALVSASLSDARAQNIVWFQSVPVAYSVPIDDAVLDVDGNLWTVTWRYAGFPAGRDLRKHDGAGAELFATDLGWGSLSASGLYQLAADPSGGVFAAGAVPPVALPGVTPPIGGALDVVVVKLDASGSIVWGTRIGGDGLESPGELAPDGLGGVFVSGWTNSSAGFGGAPQGTSDAFVARLDASGALGSVTRVGSAGLDSAGVALAPDGAGGVFLGGYSVGIGSFPTLRLLVRVDAAGSIVWNRSGVGGVLTVSELEPDGSGGVVAFGHAGTVFGAVLTYYGDTVARYDAAGQSAWVTSLTALTPVATSIAVAQGAVFAADRDRLWSLDLATGNPIGAVNVLSGYPVGVVGIEALRSDGRGGLALMGSEWVARAVWSDTSAPGCNGIPNSTGRPATAAAAGRVALTARRLTLYANDLPGLAPGYFLAARAAGFVPNPGGSLGNLCLGAPIGRLNRPGEVLTASPRGDVALVLDPLDLPTATGSVAIQAGETWHFQLWYRDQVPGATSNLSGSFFVAY